MAINQRRSNETLPEVNRRLRIRRNRLGAILFGRTKAGNGHDVGLGQHRGRGGLFVRDWLSGKGNDMSLFLEGIGAVVKKVVQFIPGKVEGLKNEKERLLREREILLSKEFSATASRRIAVIDQRVSAINGLLENKATD